MLDKLAGPTDVSESIGPTAHRSRGYVLQEGGRGVRRATRVPIELLRQLCREATTLY